MNRTPPLPVLVLAGLGLLAAACGGFIHVAPNRLLSGHPYDVHRWLWVSLWALALVGGLLPWRGRAVGVAGMAWALLVLLPWVAGHDASDLLSHLPPATRVQAGAGFWSMGLLAALLLLDPLRSLARGWRVLAWATLLAVLTWQAASGVFDAMALAREYRAQRAAFGDAVVTHLLLATVTLVLALLAGVPLGWWAWRAPRGGGALLGLLGFLQTVPSLALFALLIGPFAWLARAWPALGALGFGGTGAAPAVFALWLYALLPVVRYTNAGLDAVPADTREAAVGLGMSRGQVLARVQLPLGWPVLLAGLRIVAVQTIGLAAVAALIGAGGLGRFVFLGIGQGATDMVLLGTLAIIALALAVDMLFQSLLGLTEKRP